MRDRIMRGEHVVIRLNAAERAMVGRVALSMGVSVSEAIRRLVRAAAHGSAADPGGLLAAARTIAGEDPDA